MSLTKFEPLNYKSFDYHLPRLGGKHRSIGNENNAKLDLKRANYEARHKATQKLNNGLSGAGSFEQKRVAVFHHLSHPESAPVYHSLGINPEQSMLNGFIADNVKRYLDK